MATRNQNLEQTWSGSIGPVVMSSWRGIPYVRSNPSTYRDRRSVAQLTQRDKMSQCHELVRSMLVLVKIGYRAMAVRKSAYNVCMSRNMRGATEGSYPEVKMAYERVLLGEGPLAVAAQAEAEVTMQQLVIRWNNLQSMGNADATDRALVAIYNVQRKSAILWLRHAARAEEMVTIALPKEWQGEALQVYMGFENLQQSLCSNIVHVQQKEVVTEQTLPEQTTFEASQEFTTAHNNAAVAVQCVTAGVSELSSTAHGGSATKGLRGSANEQWQSQWCCDTRAKPPLGGAIIKKIVRLPRPMEQRGRRAIKWVMFGAVV